MSRTSIYLLTMKEKTNRKTDRYMLNYYDDKTLKAYCHYPLILAKQECKDSHMDLYRIVTINWTVATDHSLESKIVDYEHVHKNIYEMTLAEFLEWWWGMEEVAEDVVSIEKITNI